MYIVLIHVYTSVFGYGTWLGTSLNIELYIYRCLSKVFFSFSTVQCVGACFFFTFFIPVKRPSKPRWPTETALYILYSVSTSST